MLENLINLVKEHAGDAIINNPAIPNERNDEAIQTTASSITAGLQQMLSGGGLKDVLNLFSGQAGNISSSPVTQNISGGVIQNLMSRFGLSQQSASGIAGNLVPNVLQTLVSKTNDPNDHSFDIQSIFNHLSGGNTQGINVQDVLGRLTQGQPAGSSSGAGLQQLESMFSAGGNGGGALDTLKGLFNR